ncbi:lipopolysaccharide heptosyltransferase II [Gammaproteobacteria bacterium 45_16_T64]|nr:lipopolysaccharide heptosyltransferase II [Gammaproteobacteria bacterium 45_16_T64]
MKILVVGPSWVGDMVMAQSLFISIKRQQPDACIDVLAPNWSRPIIERMPEVNAALALPFDHGDVDLKARKAFGLSLQSAGYDQAILLPNSLKSALIPFWAKIPKRTGWRGEMRYILLNDLRPLNKEEYPLMIQRFVALAYPEGRALPQALPYPSLDIDIATRQQAITKYQLPVQSERKVLALCPGAEFGESKRWPSDKFAKLAGKRIDQGWQVWLFGSANDEAVVGDILERLSEGQQAHCFNLAGKTSLAEAVDLLSLADAVVSNDSGLMHIAAALDRPLVVPYGSTSPDFTPPLSDKVKVERIDLECSPCFERQCPLGHGDCMKKLRCEQIDTALGVLLHEQANQGSDN